MPYKDPEKQREYNREYGRKYRIKNAEKTKLRIEKWRQNNLEKRRLSQRRWTLRNPDYALVYSKRRYYTDMNYRLRMLLRNRIRFAIAANSKVGSAVRDLGCSIEMLKSWLMYQFQPGMTWENYGEWEIDHVKPLASFDLGDRMQFLEACNWYNLQPLWRNANRQKRAKYAV